MIIRRWMALVGLLVVAVTGGGPATAADGEPQVVDGCGADGVAAEPTDGATTPWTDICTGLFETLPGGPGLKVTATFASDIPDDRIGLYAVQWRVGDCAYRASHESAMGEYSAGGVHVSDRGGDWLRVRCGAGVERPCSIAGSSCTWWPDERHYGLVDAVTVAGNTVAFTLRFAGELDELANTFRTGTQLTNLRLESATKVVLIATTPGYCHGTTCGDFGGDVARGAGYTMGG